MPRQQPTDRRRCERRSRRRSDFDRRRRIRRDALIARYLPLARGIASRFVHRGVPLDDLYQVASIGLLNAADRYDHARCVRFETFAVPTIIGEIKRYFRDRTWDLGVPSRIKQRHVQVSVTIDSLEQALGRSPTVDEIASAMNMGSDEVLEAIEAGVAHSVAPLEANPTNPREPSRDRVEVVRGRDRDQVGPDDVEDRMDLACLLDALPPRQALIIRMHYWHGLTQGEIATRLGISQMHVSRLLRRSIDELREVAVAIS